MAADVDRSGAIERTAEPAIGAWGLGKRFGAIDALREVDLEVQRGAFFALVGPNGAGKSTAVRVLSGIIPPSAGGARVLGFDVARQEREVRARVGVVPDFPVLFDDLSPRENGLRLADLRGMPRSVSELRIEELGRGLGLDAELDRPVRALSHGARKKATLVSAMVHAPPLLFLDEPFEGIDPISAHVIREMLDDLRLRGVTLLLTSHVLPLVERLATDVAILEAGRIVAAGPIDQVTDGYRGLEEAVLARLEARRALPALEWYRP